MRRRGTSKPGAHTQNCPLLSSLDSHLVATDASGFLSSQRRARGGTRSFATGGLGPAHHSGGARNRACANPADMDLTQSVASRAGTASHPVLAASQASSWCSPHAIQMMRLVAVLIYKGVHRPPNLQAPQQLGSTESPTQVQKTHLKQRCRWLPPPVSTELLSLKLRIKVPVPPQVEAHQHIGLLLLWASCFWRSAGHSQPCPG